MAAPYQSYPPSLWADPAVIDVTISDLTVTVDVAGGVPDVSYQASWGDGNTETVTLDGSGNATLSHTYPAAGDYPALVKDEFGRVVLSQILTVTAPAPEPPPEPEGAPEVTSGPDEAEQASESPTDPTEEATE